MLGEKPSGILNAVGSTITKRTSVMTPLIVLDFIVGLISIVIYFKNGAWFMFIIFGISLLYTFKKYEDFSKTQPWMLSSEKIQKYGMQLTMGDNTNTATQQEIIEMKSVENPANDRSIRSENDRK